MPLRFVRMNLTGEIDRRDAKRLATVSKLLQTTRFNKG